MTEQSDATVLALQDTFGAQAVITITGRKVEIAKLGSLPTSRLAEVVEMLSLELREFQNDFAYVELKI